MEREREREREVHTHTHTHTHKRKVKRDTLLSAHGIQIVSATELEPQVTFAPKIFQPSKLIKNDVIEKKIN